MLKGIAFCCLAAGLAVGCGKKDDPGSPAGVASIAVTPKTDATKPEVTLSGRIGSIDVSHKTIELVTSNGKELLGVTPDTQIRFDNTQTTLERLRQGTSARAVVYRSEAKVQRAQFIEAFTAVQ